MSSSPWLFECVVAQTALLLECCVMSALSACRSEDGGGKWGVCGPELSYLG